ncbi:MAG TPA: biotin--[acetyl-CoA-carboxylase] ligase [Caulobacteraceae bacterium]|nr:biotin--[acetyl-CoA-carboxylase] ligase [Caulobacteraceae bacterium]
MNVPNEWFDEIDSTNAEARRRAEAGKAGPVWIAAREQSAGRGRRGRSWASGRGNLHATLLCSTDKPPAEAAQVSFVAALAVADFASTYVPARLISLKWPNDTLIGGRKASGILVESGGVSAGRLWVCVGIGVNLATAPSLPDRPTTCLADHISGPPPSAEEALDVLAEAFARWHGVWVRTGFAPVAEAWTARAHGLGAACTANLPEGVVAGVAEGLEADGALRLRLPDGAMRRISAGDVFFEGFA